MAPHVPTEPTSAAPPLSYTTTDREREASSTNIPGYELQQELQSFIAPLPQSLPNNSVTILNAYIDKLSKPEREMFLKHTQRDLAAYVKNLEQSCREQGGKSRAVKVAKLVKPLFETMNLYAPIAQTMIQTDPTSSALVLGGITCIMSISSRFYDYQEKIVNMLAEMGEKLEILLQYGSDIYPNNKEVQSSLMVVFGDILQFCSQVWNIFRHENGEPRSSGKAFILSLGKSFEMKFGDILSKFNRDLELFNQRALLCDRKESREIRSLQLRYMQHQVLDTSRQFGEMRSISQRIIKTIDKGHLEEAQNRMGRHNDNEDGKQEKQNKEREEKRRSVLAWLPSAEFHKDQEEKCRKLLKGTGQWLLNSLNFQLWKDNPHSDLLWVHGKRGCGKSYLASQVIQSLSKANEGSNNGGDQHGKNLSALAYIYCSSLNSAKVDPSKLLGSILKQLCHHLPRPEIEPWLEQLYDRQSEVRPPDQSEIKDAIIAILGCFTQTFIVVDGLDECHEFEDDQFDELCQFLRSLTFPLAKNTIIKVVVFSRPEYGEIKEAFSGCSFMAIDVGLNNNDIKQFIAMKLSGNGFYVKKSPALLTEVEKSLLLDADGMFLWVDLVVNALKGQRTEKDIRATVRELPRNLDTVYENAIMKILEKEEKVRERVLKILLWITNAKRPLRRDELLEGLVIEAGMKDLDDESRILDDDDFTSDCADLIVLDNEGYYHLLHSSLKEYLISPPTTKLHVPIEYRVMQTNAEKTLAEICLNYLTIETFNRGPINSAEELLQLLEKYPFLEYASVYWGKHVGATNQIELKDLVSNFLTSDEARDLSIQILLQHHGKPTWQYSGSSSPLHVLAIFGLLDIAKSMPALHSTKAQLDGYLFLPLYYAAFYKSRQMCIWLLECFIDDFVPENPPTAHFPVIHTAALNDWGEVVKMLIAWKYDPECIYGPRLATPLHFAARNGSRSAFEALIEAKVAINVRDVDGNSPLIDAASGDHLELAMRLLEEGSEIDARGSGGYTALYWAVRNGNIPLTKLLLQNGADRESTARRLGSITPIYVAAEFDRHQIVVLLLAEHANLEERGWDDNTPLLISCRNGCFKCVLSLLQAGADINARTCSKMTALHQAAVGGHLDVIEALFKERSGQQYDLINSIDEEGDTPLHVAVLNGQRAVVKVLLEKGAPVNNRNNEGRSPFYYAASKGRADLISLLLEAGADPEQRDNDSWTPLHIATELNKLCFIQKLFEVIPTLPLEARLDTGRTALHIAAERGLPEVLNFFLENGVDSNVADKDGYIALHVAVFSENALVIEKLLDIGCDGLYPSKDGRTPFFLAIGSGKVKIVNLFLDRGINGCNLPNSYGFTCLHAIAAFGNAEMLERLKPFLDPISIKQVDSLGLDAMRHAATAGNVQIIDQLIALGIPSEGLKLQHQRPIHMAASEGFLDFVHRQIKLGADVNERIRYANKSLLHLATDQNMPLLTELLLKAGAIPTARDSLGLSCLDYAMDKPRVWEKMDKWKDSYRPIPLISRVPILRNTVQRTIQAILAFSEYLETPAPKNYFKRRINLEILMHALIALRPESDIDGVRLCFVELLYPPDLVSHMGRLQCGICAEERISENWYICLHCNQRLCEECYFDYLEGDSNPNSAPKSLRVLRGLENDMEPIRKAFESLIEISDNFFGVLWNLAEIDDVWLDEKAKAYDKWENSYNGSDRFYRCHRPGQEFLGLIQKARKAVRREKEAEKTERKKWKTIVSERGKEKAKENAHDEEESRQNCHDILAAIAEELSDLNKTHRLDKEISVFCCSDHKYLKGLQRSDLSEAQKKCFTADGLLTREWLSKLLEKYQDKPIDGDADTQNSSSNIEKDGSGYLESRLEEESQGH